METMRSVAIGLEPFEPGRQLEQQREQLPRLEPEQQQPRQQQHRVPLRPQLRDSSRMGAQLRPGRRPVRAGPCVRPGKNTGPPGASSERGCAVERSGRAFFAGKKRRQAAALQSGLCPQNGVAIAFRAKRFGVRGPGRAFVVCGEASAVRNQKSSGTRRRSSLTIRRHGANLAQCQR